MMYLICVLGLQASQLNCSVGTRSQLDAAKAQCELAAHDPIGTCEATPSWRGNRWFFRYTGL